MFQVSGPMATPRADEPSLVQRAMDAVRDHIRMGALRVGDTLPGEAHFSEKLGVSRAVIREAFGALGALRLIDVGNGRKARVGALDGSVMAVTLGHGVVTSQISVADIWDVRRTIEQRTVILAAANRTADQAAGIVALAEAMAIDHDDLTARVRHDIAFHDAIANASGNRLFVQIVSSFGPLMEVAVPAAWSTRRTDEQRSAMVACHRAIARSIADGDADAAAAAMSGHFDTSIDDLLKADHGQAGTHAR